MIFNWLPQMPFTDNHQLDLDWLISKYKQLENDEATIQESLEGAEAARDEAEASAASAEEYKNDVLEWLETPANMRPYINETVLAYIDQNGFGLDTNEAGLLTMT